MQRPANPRRLLTATAVAILHAALLALLLIPTHIPLPAPESALLTVNIPNPPPPAPPEPLPGPPEPAAKSAPPAPRARPKPVVAPPPIIQPETPSPSAPTAAEGPDPTAGAANTGLGTGASGSGSGTGAGGTGTGGGTVRPRRIAGEITRRDYPSTARGAQGSVTAQLSISPEGRVTICRVTRSSGNAALDAATCRLIQQRFRYTPARDAYDNVTAQHRLVTEHFGIDTLVLVTGWSMGALQTYHWGALYPDMVPRILPFQGSAKCSRHNFVFLEGAKAALQADAAYAEGWYTSPPNRGLRAFGRVYAGWGLSQTFYRIEADKTHMGYASLEDFLVGFWEGLFYTRDANDLLAMLWTWQNGDISANDRFNGDLDAALGAIRADAILMPASTDLYFPPEDNAIEAAAMPNADLRVLDTWWGHFAGGPGTSPDDIATLDAALKELLAR